MFYENEKEFYTLKDFLFFLYILQHPLARIICRYIDYVGTFNCIASMGGPPFSL